MNPLKRLETEVQGQNLTYNFGATKSAVSQLQGSYADTDCK